MKKAKKLKHSSLTSGKYDCHSPHRLGQTTRQRGSDEYRDEVLDAPYYESFPKGDGDSKQQDAGENGTWID